MKLKTHLLVIKPLEYFSWRLSVKHGPITVTRWWVVLLITDEIMCVIDSTNTCFNRSWYGVFSCTWTELMFYSLAGSFHYGMLFRIYYSRHYLYLYCSNAQGHGLGAISKPIAIGKFTLWQDHWRGYRYDYDRKVDFGLSSQMRHGIFPWASISWLCHYRSGDTINSSLLQSLIRIFIDLTLYHDLFEEPFLHRTRLFYRSEGEKLVHTRDMADYLQHVDQRLKEEGIDRINAYVDSSSKPKLIKLVETELLERHVDTILEKGMILPTQYI